MEQTTLPPINTEPEVAPIVVPVAQKPSGFLWGILLTVFLVSAGGVVAWKKGVIQFSGLSSASPSPTAVSEISPSPTPFGVPVAEPSQEATWFTTPKSVTNLSLFKPQSGLPEDMQYYLTDSVKYTELAELADKTKVIKADVAIDAPGGDMILKCLVHVDQTVECLKNGADQWTLDSLPKILNSSVLLTDVQVDGLISPDLLTVKGVQLKKIQAITDGFSQLTKPTLMDQTTYGGVYTTIQPLSDGSVIGARGIYLRLKDNSLVIYTPLLTAYGDAKSLEVSGASYTQFIMPGCGSRLAGSIPVYIGSEPLDTKLTEAGKSSSGQSLFTTTGVVNDLTKSLYAIYSVGRNGTPGLLSLDDFSKQPTHLLWKDSLGAWQVFVNGDYSPAVECGKPVVYLYPTKTMPVSVQVGATLTDSDPLYSAGGWHVMAQPDGTLTYKNVFYPYLFWEGTGNGVYPDYRDQGTVVGQASLITSLHQQMNSLGLNAKEQADFMEFWQPRLPKTPYVRLTWLGTRAMNALAPLTVQPAPDTTIRVFLEFEGLQSYRQLTPQRLSAPPRAGFTLVEWGGLLIGGK